MRPGDLPRDGLSAAGLTDAFSGRAVRIKDEYDRRLDSASENVDLLGFGLRSFREDYAAKLPELTQRANTRLLLLDPGFPNADSSIADIRDREERNPSGAIRGDVREFLVQVLPIAGTTGSNLQVRLYRALPMINIFRIDDDLFFGPYLLDEQSRNSPTFLARRGGELFDRLKAHFDLLWSNEWSIDARDADLL